jgi:putative FmdB family regulatory protein
MPLYEYECKQCHRRTEKIQKFSDPEITECPHCGGPIERVISAPAVSFKGGGWYADGYGNAKPSSSKSEGKTDVSASSGSSSESAASSSKDGSTVSTASGSGSSTPPATAPATPASSSSSSSEKK